MPLPQPDPGETKGEWMKRCMGDELMFGEYPDEGQRYAICLSLWDEEGEKKMSEERKALPVHHTSTSAGEWDGPKAEANLKDDGDANYYRQAYAWVDPEADPDTKSAYKFIHHEVSSGGDIGPANVRACQTGIGVLNGSRGGADIPDADLEGVWQHLAAHLKDADLEPAPLARSAHPEIDALMGDCELRIFHAGELRLEDRSGEGVGVLIGSPGIPYGRWSEDLGGFVERINPAALDRTLDRYDVVCCRDHEDHLVLGRVSAGDLRLRNGKRGLDYECDLPEVSYAQDLKVSVQRGDVRGSSFRFFVLKDAWNPGQNGKDQREILEMELYEVGPVTMPAYPATALSLRSALRSVGIDTQGLGIAVRRARSGRHQGHDTDTIASAIRALNECLPAPGSGAGAGAEGDQQRLELLRLRLRTLEI